MTTLDGTGGRGGLCGCGLAGGVTTGSNGGSIGGLWATIGAAGGGGAAGAGATGLRATSGGDCAKAVAEYWKFIELDPTSPERPNAEAWIAEIQPCPVKPDAPSPTKPPLPSHRGWAMQVGGGVTFAFGVAALVTAAVVAYKASLDSTVAYDAWGLWGVGVAAATTGAAFYLLGSYESRTGGTLTDRGRGKRLAGRIAMGVGIAALIGGTALVGVRLANVNADHLYDYAILQNVTLGAGAALVATGAAINYLGQRGGVPQVAVTPHGAVVTWIRSW